MGVFDEIRVAAARVVEQARWVRINLGELRRFAGGLDLDAPDDDPGHFSVGDDEATAAFVLALDAVNFGSGYFPYLLKRPGMSGYHTVASCLRDHALAHGPITSTWLRNIAVADTIALFEQGPLFTQSGAVGSAPGSPAHDGPLESGTDPAPQRAGTDSAPELVRELMNHFALAWNQLGEFIDDVGDGTALGAVAAAGGSAARLVSLLTRMPYYDDVHLYRGRRVALLKRAQITAFDLATALQNRPPARFADLAEITMFADNLVPHVLRVEGVLEFHPDLVARIEAEHHIASGSPEEVEIRACGLHAVEMLVAELAQQGRPCTAGDLDGVLWRLGGQAVYKAQPRHRTRCTFY